MTALLEKFTLLLPCAVVLLAHLSLVSCAKFTAGKFDAFQIENQPYEFQCILTGTKDEIEKSTIHWTRPGIADQSDENVGKDDPVVNVTVEKSDDKLVSTLRAPGPPKFTSGLRYRCEVDPSPPGEINQHSFTIIGLREKAVPKMQQGNKLGPARFKEAIVLNCSVLYESNDDDYKLTLSWKKDGERLIQKTYKYKTGNITETLSYSLIIRSHTDGGDYICSWELSQQDSRLSKKFSVSLQILPFLTGPMEKEVSDEAGSDVKLECDIVGYPIRFKWLDGEGRVINGSDSRFRANEDVLYIDDIDYKDRQGYKCLGIGGNDTIEQIIILRVRDPLAPLWPFIGIVVEAVLVAAIILLSELYKRRSQNDTDGAASKTDTTDQPSTSQS